MLTHVRHEAGGWAQLAVTEKVGNMEKFKVSAQIIHSRIEADFEALTRCRVTTTSDVSGAR